MSLLKSCHPPLTALLKAKKFAQNSVIEKVKAAGLREYGVYSHQFVADEWFITTQSIKPRKIIGALNNSDTDQMLLAILRNNPSAVIEGLAIAAYATGVEVIEVVIPKDDEALKEKISAISSALEIPSIIIKVGKVNVLAARNSIIHHIETAASISALFTNESPYIRTTVMAVKKVNQAIGEPRELEYGSNLGALFGKEETEEIKAVAIGTKVYPPSILDRLIDEDFPIENGVITLFDHKICMADQAEKVILTVRRASCGICNFCREGSIQLHTMIKDVTNSMICSQ